MQNISDPTAILKREDLIAMEGPLYATLAPFFPGMSLSLFFPPKVPENMRTEHGYTILEEKDRLLLPLVQNNTLLGIMVARRTKDQSTEMPKTEVLTPVLDLCLENLRLYKAKRTDPLTELYNRGTFLDIAARDIEQICSGLESGASAWPESTFKAMFSVMVVKVDNLRHISSRYGFALSDRVLQQAAGCVKQAAPDHAVAARLEGDDEIALLLSNTNHRAGKQLARDIAAKVAGIELRTPLTRERVVLSVSAGLASFPQDIDGPGGGNAPLDTARNILEKARTARRYAAGLNRPFCAFSRILRSGGRIIEPLPLGRVLVDVGRFAGAREGQRFVVTSDSYGTGGGDAPERPFLPKAEIVLVDVRDREAMGEVLQLNDPAWPIASGDTLDLLPRDRELQISDGQKESRSNPSRDPLTGLFTHRDFLHFWDRIKNEPETFSLLIIRLGENGMVRGPEYSENQELKKIAERTSEHLPQNSVGGRYGSGSLIFFIPGMRPEDIYPSCLRMEEICRKELGMHSCMGIAGYPFLDHSRSAVIRNVHKALEHALMLSPPRVAVLDSLSFNISADRFFAEGDLFSALEEYKTSLTLDANNHLARNSLGICYARLDMLPEASSCFRETVSRAPEDSIALYNLGCVCMRLNETDEAQKAFEKVLAADPQQVFCLFRLGLLAEGRGELDRAAAYYQKAKDSEQGKTIAPRHLARVAFKKGDLETARDLLHQALVTYPRDPHSLHLLARIYLQSGDDPEMAEMLARQSASLAPDSREYLLTLSRALEAQGKKEESELAQARAQSLHAPG